MSSEKNKEYEYVYGKRTKIPKEFFEDRTEKLTADELEAYEEDLRKRKAEKKHLVKDRKPEKKRQYNWEVFDFFYSEIFWLIIAPISILLLIGFFVSWFVVAIIVGTIAWLFISFGLPELLGLEDTPAIFLIVATIVVGFFIKEVANSGSSRGSSRTTEETLQDSGWATEQQKEDAKWFEAAKKLDEERNNK